MIFVYLLVLVAALYWVIKTLGPEMVKAPDPVPIARKPKAAEPPQDADERVQKLEKLLAEKNKVIRLHEAKLNIAYIHIRDSDKIKSFLEQEIHRLREQNRIFRSELGLPASQLKENPVG